MEQDVSYGKKIWGLLTKEDKEAIIKHCTTRDSKDQPKEPARKINVTDISETLETVDSDVSDSIARLINMVHEESTGTAERLVNMTKFDSVSEAHPGDIRRILSAPKKPSGDNSVTTVSTDKKLIQTTRDVNTHTNHVLRF